MIDPNAPLIRCEHCEEGQVACEDCQGRGYHVTLVRGYGGIREDCADCGGEGTVGCEHCEGQGEVQDPAAELDEEAA